MTIIRESSDGMAYHRTNLGSYAVPVNLADMDGYVPEADDGPWDLTVDHGTERTHDADGELTAYGEWWEEEGYPAWQREAITATVEAEASLAEWQDA